MSDEIGLKTPQIEILVAQERFMARLGTIDEGKYFIWKGGSLVLRLYKTLPKPRYTVDLDLMLSGFDINNVTSILEKACNIDLKDGFKFSDISQFNMKRDTPYGGTRFRIHWSFFKKSRSQTLDIDICAGDKVSPRNVKSKDIFLLNLDEASVAFKVYPAEYIFAEKLETIFRFSTGNTRVKDFVDLWTLSQDHLGQNNLSKAVLECFQTRNTSFDTKVLKNILSDKIFLDDLEQRKQRHFPTLEIPSLKTIAQKILEIAASIA